MADPAETTETSETSAPAGDPPADPPRVDATGRPEWLPETMWDAEAGRVAKAAERFVDVAGKRVRTGDVFKSWHEAHAKLASRGAPPESADAYKVELAEPLAERIVVDPDETAAAEAERAGKIVLRSDDPLLERVRAWGLKHGVPAAGFAELVNAFYATALDRTDAEAKASEEAWKAWPDAPKVQQALQTWVDGRKASMPEGLYDAISGILKSPAPEALRILDWFRSQTGEPKTVQTVAATPKRETSEDLARKYARDERWHSSKPEDVRWREERERELRAMG